MNSNIYAIIVDDSSSDIDFIKALIKKFGCDSRRIWPETNRDKLTNWDSVAEKLEVLCGMGWDPDKVCCLLFLDVALGEKREDAINGVGKIHKLLSSTARPYVNIIVSDFSEAASVQLKDDVDSIIGKKDLYGTAQRTREAPALFEAIVRQAILKWGRRTNRTIEGITTPVVDEVDSPSIRRLRSADTGDVISCLAWHYARDWNEVKASAIGGGFSGAFLIQLEGNQSGSTVGLIFKIARDSLQLEREIAAYKESVSRLPHFNRLLPQYHGSEVERTIGADDWYHVAIGHIVGRTLEDAMIELTNSPRQIIDDGGLDNEVAKWLSPIEDAAISFINDRIISDAFLKKFEMRSSDVSRFNSALPRLIAVRDGLVSRQIIPDLADFSCESIEMFANGVVADWHGACFRAGITQVPVYFQHGDLNPRNILLDSSSHPVMIDFARADNWPIAYDFVRLTLQTLLRSIHVAPPDDLFPDKFKEWISIWEIMREGLIGRDVELDISKFDILLHGPLGVLRRLAGVISRISESISDDRLAVDFEQIVTVMACFDAIRICSYDDASEFKKLWFLYIAMDCARRGRLLT